jgi:hypothetical protein
MLDNAAYSVSVAADNRGDPSLRYASERQLHDDEGLKELGDAAGIDVFGH